MLALPRRSAECPCSVWDLVLDYWKQKEKERKFWQTPPLLTCLCVCTDTRAESHSSFTFVLPRVSSGLTRLCEVAAAKAAASHANTHRGPRDHRKLGPKQRKRAVASDKILLQGRGKGERVTGLS